MLLLATEAGELIRYDINTGSSELIFSTRQKDAFMGIAETKEYVYLASLNKLFKLDKKNWLSVAETISYSPSPDFHQMQIYDDKLYTTITKQNQIWVYDLNLNLIEENNIAPPFPEKKVEYKKNYNHINNIIKKGDKFYINHNWYTSTPYSSSGVAVLDLNFNQLEKFEFGWESHDFQFIGEKMVALCASSSKRKKIIHPYKAGLIVNGELVFEHDPNHAFCKGLVYDEEHIFLCGGRKETRLFRRNANAVIYKLSRKDYSLIEEREFDNIRSIKGCILST